MHLPQSSMDMTDTKIPPEQQAEPQSAPAGTLAACPCAPCDGASPANACAPRADTAFTPDTGSSALSHSGGTLGMSFGSQFSRPNINASLPAMPGNENVQGVPIDFGAGNPAGAGADGGAGRVPDLNALMADLAPGGGDAQLMGLDAAGTKKREPGNVELFLRQLLLGGKDEQRPDKDLGDSVRETANRILGKGDQKTQQGAQPQEAPGLFAAMDAPLRGLTPDDILFANEVDAALSRRPRFGVRALSISVGVFFLCLILWAAVASVDEVTHAEGSVVGSQRTQTIQNLEGGILRAVLVHEGQIVNKGTVLAQLDNEMAESAYRDAVNKAMENSLSILRLEAEIKDEQPVFPDNLAAWAEKVIGRKVEPDMLGRAHQIIQDQENAWHSHREQLKAEIDVLQSQHVQRLHDVEELTARKVQLDRSLEISIEQRNTAYALVQQLFQAGISGHAAKDCGAARSDRCPCRHYPQGQGRGRRIEAAYSLPQGGAGLGCNRRDQQTQAGAQLAARKPVGGARPRDPHRIARACAQHGKADLHFHSGRRGQTRRTHHGSCAA